MSGIVSTLAAIVALPHGKEREDMVKRLAESHAALLIVGSADPQSLRN